MDLQLLDDDERAELTRTMQAGRNIFDSTRAWMLLRRDDRRRGENAAPTQKVSKAPAPLRATARGLRGLGGGRTGPIPNTVEYRGTTLQVAGLWPWPVGAGAPLRGVPLGSHLYTGAPVCFDPLSWFVRAKFLQQPSMMLLGLPGFGKSTLARKIVLGLVAGGVTALILGDLKPDYRKLVEELGDAGQVITVGHGHAQINPLDLGPLAQILPILDAAGTKIATKMARIVRTRIGADRLRRVVALLQLNRGRLIEDYEESAIGAALDWIDAHVEGQPLLSDLERVLDEGPPEVVEAYKATDQKEYLHESRSLRRSLHALRKGVFGQVFDGHTTTPIDINAAAVCVDVSQVAAADRKLKGAVLLTCWEHGFAATDAAHILADAECGPKRNFLVVLDEMWQVLRAGVGMVDRVDELTRLNRVWGTALLMITHTASDLPQQVDENGVQSAPGFVERAGALVVGALPRKEMARLEDIKPFTETEVRDITSWSSPPALTGDGRSASAPPGQGKFFIKIGEQGAAGIPLRTILFPSEIASGVHDTNSRFDLDTEYTKESAAWAA